MTALGYTDLMLKTSHFSLLPYLTIDFLDNNSQFLGETGIHEQKPVGNPNVKTVFLALLLPYYLKKKIRNI